MYTNDENSGKLVSSSIIMKKNGSSALKTGRLPSRVTNANVAAAASVPVSTKYILIFIFALIYFLQNYFCVYLLYQYRLYELFHLQINRDSIDSFPFVFSCVDDDS